MNKTELKQRAINLYCEAYRVEYLAIKNGVYSESELYDIRFQIQQEYKDRKTNEKNK